MKRQAAWLVVVVLAGIAMRVGAAEQAPPNLSGTWRPPTGATSRPGEPFEINIAQTADSVTIRLPGQSPETLTLRLDGQESRATQQAGQGTPIPMVSRAAWEGSKLVVTTTLTTGRGPVTVKQAYLVDGDKLTFEMVGTNADGSPAPARTATYVKVTVGPLPAPPKGAVEAGYTSLFNGKDLTGWKVGGPTDSFTVENGAIVAKGIAGAAHLYYDGAVGTHAFRNFDLKLDVVARYRSNGGIYVMTEYQPTGFPAKGFEVQLNNSHTDRIRTGSLYHVMDLSYIPAKDDEWFPMEVMVRADTITITVKGREVVRWVQPPDWAGSYDFADRKIAPGTIAFQAHDPNSTTAYANIRIKVN